MINLFLKILNMSASAGVVIIAVLAMRLFLRKAPKKWSYLLWSVVGFRLCCPVSLQAAFSLFRFQPIQPTVTQAAGQASAISYIPQTVSPSVSPSVSAAAQAAAPAAAIDPTRYILFCGVVIWCMGMAALVIYCIASYAKARNTVIDAVRVRDNIYESDRIRSPFILGFLRPKIYIPLGLDTERMRYVLAHERNHIKRLDHLVKTLAFALLTVHWFNPLCWLAFYLMGKDMEMSCDERVLESIRDCSKIYSNTLLSFAAPGHFLSASPLAFGETSVKSRIKNSLNWRKPKFWVSMTACIACIACLGACAVNPTVVTPTGSDHLESETVQVSPSTQPTSVELDSDAILSEVLASLADPDVPITVNLAHYSSMGYDGRSVGYVTYFTNYLSETTYVPDNRNILVGSGPSVVIDFPGKDQSLCFHAGGFVELRSGSEIYQFKTIDNSEDAYNLARAWYDEAEFDNLSLSYYGALIADSGQSYLEAAQEFCQSAQSIHLDVSAGSQYKYSFLQCTVEAAEDDTAQFQANGKIDENTWCFYLTSVIVPENDRAKMYCMAGNTHLYDGDDPAVPDGALEYQQCCYITKTENGWHVEIGGTGW